VLTLTGTALGIRAFTWKASARRRPPATVARVSPTLAAGRRANLCGPCAGAAQGQGPAPPGAALDYLKEQLDN